MAARNTYETTEDGKYPTSKVKFYYKRKTRTRECRPLLFTLLACILPTETCLYTTVSPSFRTKVPLLQVQNGTLASPKCHSCKSKVPLLHPLLPIIQGQYCGPTTLPTVRASPMIQTSGLSTVRFPALYLKNAHFAPLHTFPPQPQISTKQKTAKKRPGAFLLRSFAVFE